MAKKQDESRTRKQFESNIQELHAYDTGYFCGKQAKRLDRPDREREGNLKSIDRQLFNILYALVDNNPWSIPTEIAVEGARKQICNLYPDEEEIRKQERERIIGFMRGKCTEHWANSTPFRWKCPECWQALNQFPEGG